MMQLQQLCGNDCLERKCFVSLTADTRTRHECHPVLESDSLSPELLITVPDEDLLAIIVTGHPVKV